MNTSSAFFGSACIAAGVVFLLNTLNVVIPPMQWVFQWWPLLLVLLGVALMVKNPVVSKINAAVAGLVLGLIVSLAMVQPCDTDDGCTIHIKTSTTL